MTTIAISRAAHVLAFAIGLLALADHPAVAQTKLGSTLSTEVAAIEKRTGGRLGVSVTDVQSGANWSYRGKERFPLASTFKAFSCAHLLSLADKGSVDLGKRIQIQPNELETYSPVTRFNTGGKGMSLFELCDATTSMSDNTAANIILRNTGGPEALTRFIRSIGDEATRFDRFEPQLNDVGPGEMPQQPACASWYSATCSASRPVARSRTGWSPTRLGDRFFAPACPMGGRSRIERAPANTGPAV
jgi:beta-lactamase class A